MGLPALTACAHLGSLFVEELRRSSLSDFMCILQSVTKVKVCLQLRVPGDAVCEHVLPVCRHISLFREFLVFICFYIFMNLYKVLFS